MQHWEQISLTQAGWRPVPQQRGEQPQEHFARRRESATQVLAVQWAPELAKEQQPWQGLFLVKALQPAFQGLQALQVTGLQQAHRTDLSEHPTR